MCLDQRDAVVQGCISTVFEHIGADDSQKRIQVVIFKSSSSSLHLQSSSSTSSPNLRLHFQVSMCLFKSSPSSLNRNLHLCPLFLRSAFQRLQRRIQPLPPPGPMAGRRAVRWLHKHFVGDLTDADATFSPDRAASYAALAAARGVLTEQALLA